MSELAARVAAMVRDAECSLRSEYILCGADPSQDLLDLSADILAVVKAESDKRVNAAVDLRQQLEATLAEFDQQIVTLQQQLADSVQPQPPNEGPKTLLAQRDTKEAQLAQLKEVKNARMRALAIDVARVADLTQQMQLTDVPESSLAPVTDNDADLSQKRADDLVALGTELTAKLMARTEEINAQLAQLRSLWTTLGYTASDFAHPVDALLDSSDAPTLPPTEATIQALVERSISLQAVTQQRRAMVEAHHSQIVTIQGQLGVSTITGYIAGYEAERAVISESVDTLSAGVMQFYKDSLATIQREKAHRMKDMVSASREKLRSVYAELKMTQEEQNTFPALTGASDEAAYLSLENEVSRARSRLASLSAVFKELARWAELKAEVTSFETQVADPDRFKQRNLHALLQKEEKMRKKISTTLPATENKIIELATSWESEHGEALLIDGSRLIDQLKEVQLTREEKSGKKKTSVTDKTVSSAAAAVSAVSTPAKAPRAATAGTPMQTPRGSVATATPRPATAGLVTPAKKELALKSFTPMQPIQASPTSSPSGSPTAATRSIAAAAAANSRIPSTPATTPLRSNAGGALTERRSALNATVESIAEHGTSVAAPVKSAMKKTGLRKPTEFGENAAC